VDIPITFTQPERYVSRGAYKLLEALDRFAVPVANRVCLDLGVSTGGFAQVLLERDASLVYGLDVGQAQLHQSIRNHPRMVVLEKTNARFLTREMLPGPLPDLVTADLSFISLTKVLPPVAALLEIGADLILLVKPQFEATRQEVSRGKGIITDPAIWYRAIQTVVDCCVTVGLSPLQVCRSPIEGGSGNVEFLLHARKSDPPDNSIIDRILRDLTVGPGPGGVEEEQPK
jgi:23S rRNA (cytidine1920-2'-O)/16S rRNA (cytidine1409-2'-O)-methyltransferase